MVSRILNDNCELSLIHAGMETKLKVSQNRYIRIH